MRLQREEILKNLLETVPHGFYVDSKWFNAHGISRQLTTKYIKSGWLERAAHGLLRRPEHADQSPISGLPDWEILVLSMQHLMNYGVYVGGSTALQKRGHGHYVSMSAGQRVFLYGIKLPTWIKVAQTNANFELGAPKLFSTPDMGLDNSVSSEDNTHTVPRNWSLSMSSPERAILEAINELPETESFHTIDMIFQGLVNLRPRLMSSLLFECTSIKVKRLFLVFADRHGHAWRKHIDDRQVNLGTGDRSFVKNGKLHPKYRITVPAEFLLNPERASDAN